jgi:hypothetical protein
MLNDRLGTRRNAMLHLFLTPSPPLVAGEVLVISLPMFVAALIAAFGEKFKQSVVLHPRPETPVLSLPARSSRTIYVSRAVFEGRGFVRGADAPAATGNLSRPRREARRAAIA